ncbi:hypothetical protein B0I72DRAFT_136309 [Yarrowia lipolytica]|nr:Hypothetical protein YALI2_A00339g [Yarrowia lipolytica]RDW33536.1 hypothetical protein B0I72DRAFT_136309 [Yarrowia lipolytica]RDW48289.1 hypothetical protein B0I74DRAFT_133652 [Yarrowia lipolytica]RDW54899.1 hypothetical protein B0I75DRAFT_134114 [Yarrowia lipolytica]SEI36070.1 YALIA101S09e05248g1_1 [Yarrowia lipolytica]
MSAQDERSRIPPISSQADSALLNPPHSALQQQQSSTNGTSNQPDSSTMTDTRGPLMTQEARDRETQNSLKPHPQSQSLFNKPQIAPVLTEAASGLRPDTNINSNNNNASSHTSHTTSLLSAAASARGPDGSIAHIRNAAPPTAAIESSPYYSYPQPHSHMKNHPHQQPPAAPGIFPQHPQHSPPHPQAHPHQHQPPAPYGYAPGRLPPPGMRPPAMGYYPYYPYSADLQRMPPVDQGDASHPKLPRINVDPRVNSPEQRPYPDYAQQQPQQHAPLQTSNNNNRAPPEQASTASDFGGDRPPPKKRGRKRIEVAEVLANNDLSHCSPLGEKELEADHRKHKRPSRPQAAETTTGERQYPCTFPGCEWSFVRISDQRRHLRSHQEPLFVCPFYAEDNSCHRNGGSFTRSDVLKRHLRLVHFVQFKQSDSGWCRYCEKIFPSHKFFLDHCDTCAVNNKRKTRKGAPDHDADYNQNKSEQAQSHQQPQQQLQLTQPHQSTHAHMPPPQDVSHNEIEADQEPEADLELLSTASSMLAKEPGELPVLASHLKGQEDSDRHQKRKGRSSKSSLSGTIQAGHHL